MPRLQAINATLLSSEVVQIRVLPGRAHYPESSQSRPHARLPRTLVSNVAGPILHLVPPPNHSQTRLQGRDGLGALTSDPGFKSRLLAKRMH
jgi:hypothetical protein